jgi:hypothetical protein
MGLRLKLAPHFVFLVVPNAKPLKANELFMLEGSKTYRFLRESRRQHVLRARDRLQKGISIADLSDLD